MEVELVSVQVQAQIEVDACAVAAGAGLGRRKNPPGWQQQAGVIFGLAVHGPENREAQSAATAPTPATTHVSTQIGTAYLPRWALTPQWAPCTGLQLLPTPSSMIQVTRKAHLLPSRLFKHAKVNEPQEVQVHRLRFSHSYNLDIPRFLSSSTPMTLTLSYGTNSHFQDSVGLSKLLLSYVNSCN